MFCLKESENYVPRDFIEKNESFLLIFQFFIKKILNGSLIGYFYLDRVV